MLICHTVSLVPESTTPQLECSCCERLSIPHLACPVTALALASC